MTLQKIMVINPSRQLKFLLMQKIFQALKSHSRLQDKVTLGSVLACEFQTHELDRRKESDHSALRAKFIAKIEPIRAKIMQLANGQLPASVDKCYQPDKYLSKEDKAKSKVSHKMKGFWSQVFANSSLQMTEQDVQVLKHLSKVTYKKQQNEYHFVLEFEPNQFFENSKLTKRVKVVDGVLQENQETIHWKAGIKSKKEKGQLSFFDLFAKHEGGENRFAQVLGTFNQLEDSVLSSPLQYYLGMSQADEDDEDEYEEDEEGDFQQQDYEDEEEDSEPAQKKTNGSKPECKQQ